MISIGCLLRKVLLGTQNWVEFSPKIRSKPVNINPVDDYISRKMTLLLSYCHVQLCAKPRGIAIGQTLPFPFPLSLWPRFIGFWIVKLHLAFYRYRINRKYAVAIGNWWWPVNPMVNTPKNHRSTVAEGLWLLPRIFSLQVSDRVGDSQVIRNTTCIRWKDWGFRVPCESTSTRLSWHHDNMYPISWMYL